MDDTKYVSPKEYCEEARVSITDAVDEGVEDFLLASSVAYGQAGSDAVPQLGCELGYSCVPAFADALA